MRGFRAALSGVVIVLLFSSNAFAKTNIRDWNNVRVLQIGTTIVVRTKQGERYEGKLDHAAIDSLSIIVNIPRVMRQLIKVPRDDVKEVRTKMSRIASSVIGSGIGLGVGVGLGQIIDSKDKYGEDPGLGKAVMGFFGVLFGTVIGGGVGFGGKKVYEAP